MTEFDSIRAYEGKERGKSIIEALSDPECIQMLKAFGVPAGRFNNAFTRWLILRLNFNKHLYIPLVRGIIKKTTTSTTLQGKEHLQAGHATYISNHRDILMDPALLDYLIYKAKGHNQLIYKGMGNNLLVKPWIEKAVRSFNVFTVIRDCSPRELLANSKILSRYIQHLIEQEQSVWIAQREGRAKDSNDRTQPAVLKMLTLGYEGSFLDGLRALNISPVAICYEYDPCDYLKAQEMLCKRENPNYKKQEGEDFRSMKTGMVTPKGKVVFRLTPSINPELDALEKENLSRQEQAERVAQIIDNHIHSAYEIFDTNRKALALQQGEHNDFEDYIAQQIAKVDLPNKDEAFLREKIIEMYANPLINKMRNEK